MSDQLKQVSASTESGLNNQILEFCRHVAGSANITALAHIDKYSMKKTSKKKLINIMLVIHDFQPRVMSYLKTVNERTVFVFAVDQWIFERDVERGFLGEAIAGKLVFPYSVILGEDYLHEREVALKKRLVLELLENLTLSFPELAHRIQIKPQYFMHEVLRNRVRVFPLLAYDLSDLVNELRLNETVSLNSYNEALQQLEKEGKINSGNGYVTISKKFINQCQDPRIKIVNLSKNAPRAIFMSFFGAFPQLVNVISQNTEVFLRTQKINWRKQPEQPCLFEDPQKYVFFPTSKGLISLSDKISIKDFARRMLLKDPNEDIEVVPIGGVLNDVFLINAHGNGNETKVLAKRFKDWSGFKWFPLTLWSLGVRPFAITAQARLAKECAISEFLHSRGFNVPTILHVSNAERLVFMEYIEAESLSQAIKRISAAAPQETMEAELTLIAKAGEIMAQVHSHDIVLGDTKPENMLVKPDNTIYLIDFEQAAQDCDGDKTWDVAVFLYYAGHYIPRNGSIKAEAIAKAFINGYLKAGGDVNTIKKAGDQKYTRVFGIFTMWSIISVISNICRKTEAPEGK
jgi:Kae1-associated kinase Bud32